MALAYRDLGQTEKSRQHLALYEQNKLTGPAVNDPLIQAVNRLKTSAADYLKKGVELEAAGRIKQAIAKHERALEVDPGYVQAHSNLLILYGKMGQLEKAEQHYHAAVKLNPNRAELHYNFGVLTLEQKRYRKATGAFRGLWKSVPPMRRPITTSRVCWSEKDGSTKRFSTTVRPSNTNRTTDWRGFVSLDFTGQGSNPGSDPRVPEDSDARG